ncbi:MAG TPA: hypothetical protein VFD17_07815, partial [Clostridia bacterium]|nr:hypothetical protein [Clostridia bacterium]
AYDGYQFNYKPVRYSQNNVSPVLKKTMGSGTVVLFGNRHKVRWFFLETGIVAYAIDLAVPL